LVLALLGAEQAVRVDVLEANEAAADAGLGALLDEVRQLVAERVDLDRERDLDPLLAQLDDAVEDDLPILVARKIIVGDEEAADALLDVAANDGLDVVGSAPPRLATLHVDDGAERALIGTAAPGIKARGMAPDALDLLARNDRQRLVFQMRQVVHHIVERLQLAFDRILQHAFEPALGLAREHGDAEIHDRLHAGLALRQHRD